MPLRSLRLEHVERHGCTADARASDGKLCDHDGQAEDGQEDEIDEHERGAAILACDVREAPDIAESDGTARRDQDEAQARRKTSSFFQKLSLLFPFTGIQFLVVHTTPVYSTASFLSSHEQQKGLPQGRPFYCTTASSESAENLLEVVADVVAVFHRHDISQDLLGLDGADGADLLLDARD